MKESEKLKIISSTMTEFDFETVEAIIRLSRDRKHWRTVDQLKSTATKILTMCLEHTDRDYWWARGGVFLASWEKTRGLSLIYAPILSYTRVNSDEQTHK